MVFGPFYLRLRLRWLLSHLQDFVIKMHEQQQQHLPLNQLVLMRILRTFCGEGLPAHLVSIKYKLRKKVAVGKGAESSEGFLHHARHTDDIRVAVSDFIVIYCGRGNFLGTTKSSAVAGTTRKMSYFLLLGDPRSNYFSYQSRSVRWLYKKLFPKRKKEKKFLLIWMKLVGT